MNKNLFKTQHFPVTDTVNHAGGIAYSMRAKEALAQLVMTGTFNDTFYSSASNLLDEVIKILDSKKVNPEFVAKLAIMAREQGFMKDSPALLTAWLSKNAPEYLEPVFNRVIDSGKMLRNFVQVMRSGVVGRKSLGTKSKKIVQQWLNKVSDYQLLMASVGKSPSLSDVIKMVHPKAESAERNVFFKWILGIELSGEEVLMLPKNVIDLKMFQSGLNVETPKVPFELLTNLPLTKKHWIDIAKNASWHMTRMNLNTFTRNGVFENSEGVNLDMVKMIANRLSNPDLIDTTKVFPYQIFTTWMYAGGDVHPLISDALHKAIIHCTNKIPQMNKNIWIFVDVSGSMRSPITGQQKGGTSKIRCVDVAALITSCYLKSNPENTHVIMFDTSIHQADLNPNNIFQNSSFIAKFGGGGTACHLPLEYLNKIKASGDLLIYISDNESWFGQDHVYGFSRTFNDRTKTSKEWETFKRRNPHAKLVCIDLTPNTTTQVQTDKNILNVGGFSDQVFTIIDGFVNKEKDHWIKTIENVKL